MRVDGWLPPCDLTMGTLSFQGPAELGGTKVIGWFGTMLKASDYKACRLGVQSITEKAGISAREKNSQPKSKLKIHRIYRSHPAE